MTTFEIISSDHSEIVGGSTPYQVALAISRERGMFERVCVRELESGRETHIDGTLLLSLAYLDNHFDREDEEWSFE